MTQFTAIDELDDEEVVSALLVLTEKLEIEEENCVLVEGINDDLNNPVLNEFFSFASAHPSHVFDVEESPIIARNLLEILAAHPTCGPYVIQFAKEYGSEYMTDIPLLKLGAAISIIIFTLSTEFNVSFDKVNGLTFTIEKEPASKEAIDAVIKPVSKIAEKALEKLHEDESS